MATTYLSVVHLATAGLNGPLLGSDEEEIVLICLVVVNIQTNQVVTVQDYWVKPRSADINENVLSEQAREEMGLSEELIRTKGNSLEQVLSQVDSFLQKVSTEVDQKPASQAANVVIVTDGQLPLRQCLLPETCSKGIADPPAIFGHFYDLRKEFRKAFPNAPEINSIQDMINYLNLEPEETAGVVQQNATRREAQDMGRILQRLVKEGHKFDNPETIHLRLEPGICSKDEEVDSNTVVRARGLPWQSSDQDIARFFRGLNVARGGVALCLSAQGRRNGEALVRFVSSEHRDMALKRHKHHIGPRYIEVYKATGDDFIDVAGGSNNEAQNFLSRSGQVIVRMRGLPYDCTAKQVVEFFESGGEDVGSTVLDGDAGVLFVKKHDGRATGDAFVMFATEEEGSKALAKHRDIIGSRYIELFRSTTAEVQQVLNRSMDPRTYETQAPLIPQLPQMPLLPQQMITSGTRKDCIRLRGLPYEAQVEHILEFLGEHAKSIVYQGVHMVYNAQGQPSGEAFIQMDSEQSSFQAAHQRHHRYMVFGKKQRYIEVFQCSGEDMHVVLTGGLALPSTPATPKALLSPGMLPWDQLSSPAAAAAAAVAAAAAASSPLSNAQAQLLQAQAQAQVQAQAMQEQAQAQAQAVQIHSVQAQLAAHALKQQEGLWLMGLAPPPSPATSNPSLSRPPPTPSTYTLSSRHSNPTSVDRQHRSSAGPIGAQSQQPPPSGLGLLGQGGVRPAPFMQNSHQGFPHLGLGMGGLGMAGLGMGNLTVQQELAALQQFPMLSANFPGLNFGQIGATSNGAGASGASAAPPSLNHPHHPLFLLGLQHGQNQLARNNQAGLANALQAAKATGSFFPGMSSQPASTQLGGGFKRSWEAAFQQQQQHADASQAVAAAAMAAAAAAAAAKRQWPPHLGGASGTGAGPSSSLTFPSSIYPAL